MTEYIDVAAARAFVEANYQGNPLLRHLYGTLLEKLPTVPNSSPMFLLNSAPADADILKTLASSPVIYSTGEETIIPLMPDRWIPVTERLPTEDDFKHLTNYECLVVERHYNLFDVSRYVDRAGHAYWTGDEFISGHSTFHIPLNVTHWMPLPEPPKEE